MPDNGAVCPQPAQRPEELHISAKMQQIQELNIAGRHAAARQDWATVQRCAQAILNLDEGHPEGHFLSGLFAKAARNPRQAMTAFETVLRIDAQRYDAAVELATQLSMARRNGEAAEFLGRYEDQLSNSPKYLDMAATTYTEIGLPERAWPLYRKAVNLQPDISLFKGNLAACAVYIGEMETAKATYRELLQENPTHQRNHYHLSRAHRARDTTHIDLMLDVLDRTKLPPERNIFLYYALGKEYEDLGLWDEAFGYYKKGADAAYAVSGYDVKSDVGIIDTVIEVCDRRWIEQGAAETEISRQPLFIVGLPRTGTTLTERIIASHSRVISIGETEFIQMMIRKVSGVATVEKMTPDIIKAAAAQPAGVIRDGYLDTVAYRLGDEPIFIDKLPFNVLYLGFIARAWPGKPIVLLKRNPMDTCFSMYKQVFTWAYKFSYNLETLGAYFIAYERLCRHWRDVLGDQLVEVQYENLVANQEEETRRLLDGIGLGFEDACLRFEKNTAPSTTASSVQVREKVYSDSVQRWRHFERHLEPLRRQLEAAGIGT
jgi:tetratricopeptide (TPR) repeat protein